MMFNRSAEVMIFVKISLFGLKPVFVCLFVCLFGGFVFVCLLVSSG